MPLSQDRGKSRGGVPADRRERSGRGAGAPGPGSARRGCRPMPPTAAGPTGRRCVGGGSGHHRRAGRPGRPPQGAGIGGRQAPGLRPRGGACARAAPQRHAVECATNGLKQHQGRATRYDKLRVRYAATVPIAIINDWL
ncbi:hypothetical protein GCM10023224_50710 [Streptomonospora halophila]|uniref:Transposase n=1 Tax=Streptomonospora halophila TaxID=427369 RepID=A0ABP9H0X6_9ACTN